MCMARGGVKLNIVKERSGEPNSAKTQLLIYINTNLLLNLCIFLGLFDRGY
jgi:hypothetical protein